jgi:ribosomal protein S18 acetylase RimI-like enzyme
MELAQAEAVPVLTLSVDADNAPALALYGGFGFRETFRRDVWIRVFQN